jgi:tetratricopeptide (TPR) repeat protein
VIRLHLPGRVSLMNIICSENRGDDCAARVDNILAQDALNYDALFQSGLLTLGKGDNTRAIRIFSQLTRLSDQDPRVWYQLALAYLSSMKEASPVAARNAFDRADDSLGIAVKLDPKFQQAVLLLADVKIRKRVPAAAQALLIPFVTERPQVAQAQYLLGTAYLAQQKPRDALQVYRHMAESFPKDPQPPFLAGQILLAERRPAEARKELEKSLEVSPTYAPAIEALVNLDLAGKQYAIALDRVQPLIEKDPAQAFGIRGKIYLAQADFSRAEPDLLKAIELDPKLQPVYLMLAQLYVASGRQDQAIAKLSETIEKNKDNTAGTIPALLQLALLQQNLKRYDAARDTYEKLLAVSPNWAVALNNLAALYSENLGQLDKAYELAKKASEAAPNEPHIADTLGWIEFKRGNYANALRLLQDSAIKLPDSVEIQFHLGMAHYMMGDQALARAALEKAVNASRDFPEKSEARHRLQLLSVWDAASNSPVTRPQLENFLRENRNDPFALFQLARMQQQEGAGQEAISTYERILASNANFSPALRQLAVLYGSTAPTDLSKAFEISTRARQAFPDDPGIAKTLGILAYRRGFFPQAAEQLKTAVAKRDDDRLEWTPMGQQRHQPPHSPSLQRSAGDRRPCLSWR